jgi:hypothetical protein
MIGYRVERVFEMIFIGQKIVGGAQIEWEFQGAHKLKTLGDVLHSALVEEI